MKNTMFSFRSQRGYITEVALVIVAVVLASGLMYASNRVSINYSNSNAADRSYPVPGGMYPSPRAANPSPSATPVPCQNYQGDGEYWLCLGNTVTTGAFSATLADFPTPTSAKFTFNPPIWLPTLGNPDGVLRSDYTFPVYANGYSLMLQKGSTTTYAFAVKAVDFGNGSFAGGRALVSVKTRVYAPGAGLPQVNCADYTGDGIYRVCAGNMVTATAGAVFKVKSVSPAPWTSSPTGTRPSSAVIEANGSDATLTVGGSVTSGGSTLYLTGVDGLTNPSRAVVCVITGADPARCGLTTLTPRSR